MEIAEPIATSTTGFLIIGDLQSLLLPLGLLVVLGLAAFMLLSAGRKGK